MNNLFKLKQMGFNIYWKTIFWGYNGYERTPSLISQNDIMAFLDYLLARNQPTDSIISLLLEKDDLRFKQAIRRFSQNETTEDSNQKRKWNCLVLQSIIEGKKDWFCTMLDLMEYWVWNQRNERTPFSFPQPNATDEIRDFFSLESFYTIRNESLSFLDAEIKTIQEEEKLAQNESLA